MRVKRAALAGRWYDGDPLALGRRVDALLAAVAATPAARLAALLIPHAGYAYSGRAAAAGYACLADRSLRRVVILAPSHFAAFSGAVVPDVEGFETPLGIVAVDTAAVAMLAVAPGFASDSRPYAREHAIEIQLPFVQRVLPGAAIVPVLLGDVAVEDDAVIAAALRPLLDDETVCLVSSDLVHYGADFGYLPFPARDAEVVRAGLRDLDGGAIAAICAGDASGFRRYVARTGATICGRVPIAVFLSLHAQRTRGTLLAYATSFDVTGDYAHCVSYAAIGF